MIFERLAKGSGLLVKFVFRREWLALAIWTVGLLGFAVAVPVAFNQMYDTEEARQGMAVAMGNPAMVAMVGDSTALDDYTVGAMNVHMMLVFMAIAIAVMNIFFVVKYTRRDEELGREEVLRSLPVGHLAGLSAVLIVALVVNLVIGALIGVGLSVLGIESIDWAGSILYGMGIAAVGLVFAGVAAVAAQLCQTARGAIGMSMIFLIGSYLMRAAGDMNSEVLARMSPLGLVLRTEAAVGNYWWPIWVLLGIAAVLVVKAFWLNAIRDMDQGFIPAKPGRARASGLLVRPIGLSLRLMRWMMIAWLVGLMLLGASYGSVLGDTESFADTIAQMTGGVAEGEDVARAFVSVLMLIMAVFACVPCLIMLLKVRGEEKRGRLEMILAGAVSRGKVIRSYLVPTLVFSFVSVMMAIVGLWGAGMATMEEPIVFGEIFRAVMVYMPAIWVMIGIGILLVGVAPKKAGFAWIFLLFAFFVSYFGGMMGLPEWTSRLTPFGWAPEVMMGESVSFLPLMVTAVVAVGLITVGVLTYRRREMV